MHHFPDKSAHIPGEVREEICRRPRRPRAETIVCARVLALALARRRMELLQQRGRLDGEGAGVDLATFLPALEARASKSERLDSIRFDSFVRSFVNKKSFSRVFPRADMSER